MDKKLLYESPITDVFVVQIEGVICQSGDFGINGFGNDPDELSGFTGI